MNDRSGLAFAVLWSGLLPALVGSATGACVAGLIWGVESEGLTRLATLPGLWPGLFAPLALLLTWLAARFITKTLRPSTSELYITLYHDPHAAFPGKQVPGRVLATTATVGLGGAQGFESTSALIGSGWGELAARIGGGTPDARRSLWAAGASAGIAAVFSSPGAGALYGIEVPFKNGLDASRLTPCVIAGVCSYATRVALIGEQRLIHVVTDVTLNTRFLIAALATAIACGLGARAFAAVEEWFRTLSHSQPQCVRAMIGGALLSGVAVGGFLWSGTWLTFGSGYIATDWLQAETRSISVLVLALLIRASANLITVYGGGGGGVFTSLAANGAFLGEIAARLFDIDDGHALALFGAACFLGAGYRLPLACLAFVAEAGLGPMATGVGFVMIAMTLMVMEDASVSDAQK